MMRKTPHVPEPDHDSQPRAPARSSWFWSIIYSVITYPFRVIGNLLGLSRRWTSEDHSPGNIQDMIQYRGRRRTSRHFMHTSSRRRRRNSKRRRTFEDQSPGNAQDSDLYCEAASTSELLEVDIDGSLPPKDYLPGKVQDHEAASTSEPLEVDLDGSLPPKAVSASEPLEVDLDESLPPIRRPTTWHFRHFRDISVSDLYRIYPPTMQSSNLRRASQSLLNCAMITREKPVAILNYVPPPPPPPNPHV